MSYPPGVLRADIFRILALYRFGGVYADIDVECLRPIDELLERMGENSWQLLLPTDHPIHERTIYNGRTMWMNNFMAGKQGSEFLKMVIDAFGSTRGPYSTTAAVYLTGPGLLTRLVESMGGTALDLIRRIPWQWVHPLPDMSLSFAEKREWEQLIHHRLWKEKFNPVVVHYWEHTWWKKGTTLQQHGPQLLQTDGDIAEERLQKFVPLMGKRADTTGRALAEFAERGGGQVIELGTVRSFVPAGVEGCFLAHARYWNDATPTSWDWGAGFFTRLAAEVLQGLDFEYHGVDPSEDAIAIARTSVASVAGVTFEGSAPTITGGGKWTPLAASNIWSFHQITAEQFLREMDRPAALVYMDHGDCCEVTAKMHASDARVIIERGLVKKGGLILIDDHSPGKGQVPKSKYSLPLFLSHGFRIVVEDYQILLELPKSALDEIPRILHVFPGDSATRQSRRNQNAAGFPPGWKVEEWSYLEAEKSIINKTSYWQDVLSLAKSDSMRQWLIRCAVGNKYGGVVAVDGRPLPPQLEYYFVGRRLVFFLSRFLPHNSSYSGEALNLTVFATTKDHRFWESLALRVSRLLSSDPNSPWTGAFLGNQVQDMARAEGASELPDLAIVPEFFE